MENDIFIVGDVRFTHKASSLYESSRTASVDFLLELQKLMEEYGVVKIDVSTDAFKYINRKHQ